MREAWNWPSLDDLPCCSSTSPSVHQASTTLSSRRSHRHQEPVVASRLGYRGSGIEPSLAVDAADHIMRQRTSESESRRCRPNRHPEEDVSLSSGVVSYDPRSITSSPPLFEVPYNWNTRLSTQLSSSKYFLVFIIVIIDKLLGAAFYPSPHSTRCFKRLSCPLLVERRWRAATFRKTRDDWIRSSRPAHDGATGARRSPRYQSTGTSFKHHQLHWGTSKSSPPLHSHSLLQ